MKIKEEPKDPKFDTLAWANLTKQSEWLRVINLLHSAAEKTSRDLNPLILLDVSLPLTIMPPQRPRVTPNFIQEK